jgi:hypothetical protein
MTEGALLSPCRRYRYALYRVWNTDRPTVAFIMLNPSTADEVADDPTIRRCTGFAAAWGYGQLIVGNLFALRATDPRALAGDPDPVGADNDGTLVTLARSHLVICAWGGRGGLRRRDAAVTALLAGLGSQPYALGFTQAGAPRHPLYLPATREPLPWGHAVAWQRPT